VLAGATTGIKDSAGQASGLSYVVESWLGSADVPMLAAYQPRRWHRKSWVGFGMDIMVPGIDLSAPSPEM
jgi:hypothetical protein